MAEHLKNMSLRVEQEKQRVCLCVCVGVCVCVWPSACVCVQCRKQEAALMLGNGDDFHLGDAVIVAVLLAMLMTNGPFVSIQIYFRRWPRGEGKKKKAPQVHHYGVQIAQNETTPDMTVKI